MLSSMLVMPFALEKLTKFDVLSVICRAMYLRFQTPE